MNRGALTLGVVATGLYMLYQQGVSDTPGVGDEGDTNPDGTAAGGTDAGLIDEAQVMLSIVPDYINAMADAITVHEGWREGSRSYRNNNPGNLEIDGDLGRDSGGYGVFSSYNAGRNALVADLTAKFRKYSSWTLYQVIARYAPPSENNTQAYASAVASALGIRTQTLVGQISGIWSTQGRSWVPMGFSSPSAPSPVLAQTTPDPTDDIAQTSFVDLTTDSLAGVDLSNIDFSEG